MWMQDVKISPDGQKIAFSYKGDIYTVPSTGGTAFRLTAGDAYEATPIWSPDGSMIAFSSDRNGGRDIYIVSATGGKPTRLTSNSAAETPEAFSPDGKSVIYSAFIQKPAISSAAHYGMLTELYSVPVEGGRPVQILSAPAVALSMMPDGSFLYENVKGSEDKWRKHHTSSVTRDIWVYNPENGTYTNLTAHAGEDRSPAVAADGKSFFFLSERDGDSFNVYSMPLGNPGASPKKLTSFTTHPVRHLSSGAGDKLAFTYNGEIYTMSPGGTPAKVAIDVVDDYVEDIKDIPFSRVDEAAVSPDGKQVAFIVRGEVFVTSSEFPSTKQITHTPAIETGLSWGSDGRTLYYGSLRNGRSNIYKATIKRDNDPNFSNATIIEETPLFEDDGIERGFPEISPDGKKMAYVQDRVNLRVMDLASGNVKAFGDGKITTTRSGGFDVEWSPDSRWLTLNVMNPGHEPYDNIAIVNADDGEFITVANTAYFDSNPHFSPSGDAIIFGSERFGMRNHASWGSQYDVMMVFLTREAYDKYRLSEEDFALYKEVEEQQKKDASKKDEAGGKGKDKKKSEPKEEDAGGNIVKIDRDGLEDRIVRLTPNSSDLADYALSDDGETLYYLSAFEGGYDLWKANLRDGDVSIVKKLDDAPASISRDGDGNLYLVGSTVRKFDPKSGSISNVSTSGSVKIDLVKERAAMLDYVENEARERFYLAELPVDWKAYADNYRRFLPYINNNHDFRILLSELLGELNVSHSGARYFAPSAKDATASLGLLFDMASDNDGLLIEEVVEDGPFDRATSRVKAGDVLVAINGEAVAVGKDWTPLLNGVGNKKTLVSFRNPASGEQWDEVVLPISNGGMYDLMYERWVKGREHLVDSLSNGRLGYLHIESMNDESFRRIYAKLLGEYNDKEGIVIDTRWNGGGRLHEDIEVLFSGEKYLTQESHGVKSAEMPSRRWNKPSIMVTGEANYSNAHGTPWVYRHKKMGKIVGMPVPGTMSSVNWITLQDPSMIFGVPVIAYRTADGSVLENTQLEPDILVENLPADVAKGIDRQIEVAVKELLKQLK